MALSIGITIADFKELTIGMISDLLITKVNQSSEENERMATQADFDSF